MVHLTKLRAQSLRGLPRSWPDLSIAERGIVICGDNGVGKSSIVDALEYSLTGRSTLYQTNRLGVSWEKGSAHVRDGDPSVWVEIHSKNGCVRIAPNSPLDNLPDEARAWVARARQSTFVLRRHMLVDFVNSEPSKRYASLEPFLNLSEYDIVENGLKGWRDELNTSYASLEANKNDIETSLRSTFDLGSHVAVGQEELLSSLNQQLRKLSLKECHDINDASAIRIAIEAQLGGEAISHRLARLGALKNALDAVGLPRDLLPLIQSLKDAVHSLETERARLGRQILEDWLTRGRAIIASSLAEECPLCEQPIERTSLLARLDERIDQERTVADAREIVRVRTQALRLPAAAMLQRMQMLCAALKEAFDDVPAVYLDAVVLLKDVIRSVETDGVQSTGLTALQSQTVASLTSHSATLNKVEKKILAEGGGERRVALLNARAMVDGLVSTLPAHRALQHRLESLRYESNVVGRLLGHAVGARKDAVQDVFDLVAGLANDLYATLHPKENIGQSMLKMRQATGRSTDIATLFYGTAEHPLLHYSESHLDTLGICYFLAFRRYEANSRPGFKLAILDDVLHSVDAAHRTRFTEILARNFADHQLVITTHDPIFFNLLRQRLGGACVFSRIIGWDIALGPRFAKFGTDFEKLLFGDPSDMLPEDVAASAGRLLEGTLRNLTERLGISAPVKFERPYTIGDLWPPLSKAFNKQKGFESANPRLIERLDSTYWVRNASGAHPDQTASPVTNHEIFEFRDSLLEFIRATLCSTCNMPITKRSNGDWKCECELLHYERTLNTTQGNNVRTQKDLFPLAQSGS